MSLIVNDSQHQEASNIRRAYKIAQNAVHKLKSPSSTQDDLWSVSQRRARGALRDNVRRVLLGAPGEYGEMKLELLAWQYGVHQVIGRVKKERGRHQQRARDFLEAQHGWYAAFMHQLADKLAKYGGAENIVFDWWQCNDEEEKKEDHTSDDEDEDNDEDKAKIQQILTMLCCKTLLCLGDICRYQHDLYPELYSNKLSYRYYMQAWHIEPASGMPWNNIGSLMQNNYHGVFSVFFYRRCLQSENPYVDCYKNLKHLFDKSKRAYAAYPRQQMDSIPIGAAQNERKQAIYWLCNVFTHLNGLLRPATYCTERELNTCCRRLLDLLDLCLYFTDSDLAEDEDEDDKKPGFIKRQGLKVIGPGGLTNSSLVTIFAVLIQSFDDLRNHASNRLGAANSLFVAASDFVIQHMISTISDFEEGNDKSEVEDEDQPEILDHDDDEKENLEPVETAQNLRRRRNNYSDSEDNLSEGSEAEIFFSEDEEDDEEDESVYSQEHESENEEPNQAATSTYVAISTQNANNNTNHPIIEEDEDEDEEEEEVKSKPKLACTFMRRENVDSEDDDDDEEVDDEVVDDDDDEDGEMVFEFEEEPGNDEDDDDEAEINIAEVVAHFDQFVYMDVIKLICDWLMANGEIIMANEKSPLWPRLAHLCNMLPMAQLVAERGRENISPHILKAMDQDNWMQPYSLWEDRFLYGIPIMGDVHDHIDFKEPPRFNRWDANLLRLMCVRKFMKHLVATYPQLGIKLDVDGVRFNAPSIETLDDDEFNIRGTFETDEGQKHELVVVVPTPDALANHLESFKAISERGDCSIIVTNITVDGLDEMKSTRKEARDTTRWLETQLARCSGNIQSMQQAEQKSLQRLRRQDRHAWTLQHLINIGAKLQKQKRDVILLVDQVEPGHLSPSVRKALSSASANNLSIQTVDDYSTRK